LAIPACSKFAVLLPSTMVVEAFDIAQWIRLAVAEHIFHSQGRALPLTVSIGVASANYALTIDQCLKNADEALYAAKGAGRNRVACFES
jgi:diguanylate cyclase (GGDEF)-like protein